jgi:ABC-type branched-subunit amino acid transport system substrate-binding protein
MKALSLVLDFRHALDRGAGYLYSFARSKVFTPFLNSVLSIVLLTRLTGFYTGPDSYLIYFVGPLGGNTSLVKMENIFKRASARTLNGVPVKFEEIDDAGDPALARTIAKSLASKPETLMVVGHVLSSTTKEALPVYMNAEPQIPVILTTETNPQILPASADPDEEFPVFRLSPTDDDQAKSAYQFARNLGAQRFWVVEDPANAVYTKYLANKFLEDAQRNTTRVLLQTSVMNPPATQLLERLGVQWVFFAGEWRGALMLIRSLKALAPLRINFILSDGAASAELLANGGSDVEGVYVMHQLKAKDFRDQGYGVYANNALEIIDRLLAKADQRFSSLAREEVGLPYIVRQTLRIHRVSDARRVLIKCMNRTMASPFRMSTGEVFRFRKDGTREGAKFNIWKIQKHEFVDIDQATGPQLSKKLLARTHSREMAAATDVAMR